MKNKKIGHSSTCFSVSHWGSLFTLQLTRCSLVSMAEGLMLFFIFNFVDIIENKLVKWNNFLKEEILLRQFLKGKQCFICDSKNFPSWLTFICPIFLIGTQLSKVDLLMFNPILRWIKYCYHSALWIWGAKLYTNDPAKYDKNKFIKQRNI